MRTIRTATRLLVAAGMLAVVNWSAPGRVEAQSSRSLDDELLDDFDREFSGPDHKQGSPGDLPGEGGDDLADRLRRELGAAGISEDDNPLLEVARRMREVEGRIGQNDSGPTTQQLQKQIIVDLNQLIQQVRKRRQQGKPGTSPSQQTAPGSPQGPRESKQGPGAGKPGTSPASANASRTGNGKNRKPNMVEMYKVMEQLWEVALPPRQRQQMMDSLFEEFLPKYELLIEQYFRRLSEEEEGR